MKALNFNKNSWHYRLVTKLKLYEAPYKKDVCGDGKLYTIGDSADICTYSKAVLLALVFITLFGAIAMSALVTVVHTLLGIYFSVMLGQWFFDELGLFGFTLMIIGFVVFTVFKTVKSYYDYKDLHCWDSKKPKQDTFFSNAYKSWKNKFCVPIKFDE
jgi:hypothetical protein